MAGIQKGKNRYRTASNDMRDLHYGRMEMAAGLSGLSAKLARFQAILNAENKKRKPNPAVVEKYTTLVARLQEILANAARMHTIR